MDIRIINRDGRLYNVSRMHLSVSTRYLIALTEDYRDSVTIEQCKNEEEANDLIDSIIKVIKGESYFKKDNIIIDLRKEPEDGKSEVDKKEY